MAVVYQLPTREKDLVDAVNTMIMSGERIRNVEQVKWLVSYYYMQGVRQFDVLDYARGDVTISYRNEKGALNFRYDEITAQYTARLGRLLALDISPAVDQKGMSLEGVRKRSVAQVVLNNVFPQDKVEETLSNLNPPLTTYGTVGLGLWVNDVDSMGADVIPPWELLPIPTNVSGQQDVRGLMRIRWVPKKWAESLKITPNRRSQKYKDVDSIQVPFGVSVDARWRDERGEGAIMASGGNSFSVKSKSINDLGKKGEEETQPDVTRMVEVWTETADGYLAEYAVLMGQSDMRLLYREDHTDEKYHMPIRVLRDTPVTGFWGRSFVDQLIPLNHELETAMSNLFEYLDDFDLFGLLLWPASLGTPDEAVRGQDGIKRIVYEPDYTVPDQKPFQVAPARLTAPQIQAVNVALGLMDRIANQPREMMGGDAPGRVDSSTGLGFLYETSSIPLSPTATSIAQGVSGIYRAALRILKDNWTDSQVIELSNLDDTLAGIVLDADSGTLSLSQNAIPYPDEVTIKISSAMPVSVEQQKQELKEALSQQRITLEEYTFEVRKRGLDLPVGMEIEWHNYQRAMLENLILFGDGKTPGRIITTERDLHRVHLKVLESFMARPAFFLASAEVRNVFEEHWNEHRVGLGGYPDQLPQTEDIAGLTMGAGMPPQIQ